MFISYDIRGVYPKEINEGVVSFLAKKFYQFLKRKKIKNEIFLGIDFRKSSPNLASAFTNSYLNLPQAKIEYLGIIPTPLFYYKCIKEKRAGAMITASHLPLKFNGIKFLLPNGESWVYRGKIFTEEKNENRIEYKNIILENLYEEYVKDLQKLYRLKNTHYINLDNKNKSVNYFLFKVLSKVDKKIKIKKGSSLKIFSDLDGDRLWITYKNIKFLPEQILYAILKSGFYKKIGIPLHISKKILKIFNNLDFVFIPTGHSNFKKAFMKYNLDFAFEPTFHYYFFKEIKTESPLLGFLRFLEEIEKYGIEEILRNQFYIKRFEIRKKINLEKIINFLKKEGFRLKKFDGFNFSKYYNNEEFLVIHFRKSKTEKDVFRFFLEGSSQNNLKFLYKLIKKII